MNNRFIFTDTSKCIGCLNCELACAASYLGIPFEEAYTTSLPLIARNRVVKVEGKIAPMQCMHCSEPSCMAVCPHGVIEKEKDFIKLNEEQCVGCGSCLLVCPYGAIHMVPKEDKRIAIKCNLCFDKESGPSCLQHCPTHAIFIIDTKRYTAMIAEGEISFHA